MPTLNDKQRRQHVVAGELQRVLQREREAEAVHEPEARTRSANACAAFGHTTFSIAM